MVHGFGSSLKKVKSTKMSNALAVSPNFLLREVIYMKETRRAQDVYLCPECGKPFEEVSATESHLHDVYEVRVKASHAKPHE